MTTMSKAQLAAKAKNLGLKVDPDWTRTEIQQAIDIAEADAAAASEAGEVAFSAVAPAAPFAEERQPNRGPEAGAADESRPAVIPPALSAPPPPPAPVATATSKPTLPLAGAVPMSPPVAPSPPSFDPRQPRVGAGRYRVLWTVTLPGGPVHDGVVALDDAQARSLVKQGAVVHVDEYDAYMAYQRASAKAPSGAPHPARVPMGAGRYRTLCGVMKGGKEIPAGTVAQFTAVEVAGLTRPGMIAIEFAD